MPARHGHRLGAEGRPRLGRRLVPEGAGQTGEESRSEWIVGVREQARVPDGERDQLAVGAQLVPTGSVRRTRGRSRASKLSVVDAAADGRGCEERVLGAELVARARLRVTEENQHEHRRRSSGDSCSEPQRHLEQTDGFLVGESPHRFGPSLRRVLDGLCLVTQRTGLEEVMGELSDESTRGLTHTRPRAPVRCRRVAGSARQAPAPRRGCLG